MITIAIRTNAIFSVVKTASQIDNDGNVTEWGWKAGLTLSGISGTSVFFPDAFCYSTKARAVERAEELAALFDSFK